MNDITDQDRRDALAWAANVSNQGKSPHLALTTAARVILATVDAPEPTLAEALKYRADLLDNGDPDGDTPQALRDLATDAAQMERDLAEARAEVARLTAERDRLEAAQRLSYGSAWGGPVREPTVQKCAESNAESLTVPSVNNSEPSVKCSDATVTDPADVKPGEAWLVELDGQRATALKDNDGLAPWSIVGPDGRCRIGGDTAITLVSRLVPAPRVITTVAELDALPDGTIIQDAEMSVGEKSGNYWDTPGSCCDASSDYFILPVTVLWEPDA